VGSNQRESERANQAAAGHQPTWRSIQYVTANSPMTSSTTPVGTAQRLVRIASLRDRDGLIKTARRREARGLARVGGARSETG